MTNKNLKIQYILFSLLLLVSIFTYVFQVSALTKETYLIEDYQQKIDSYSKENSSLEYKFLQNNSFFEVENIAQELNFEEVGRVSYIEVSGSEVVVK
ncbi:MAG: hypothetical protein ACQEP3_02875 [Patescibacteria group bacterium]